MRTARFVLPLLLAVACTHSSNGANPTATPTEEDPCTGASPAPGCVEGPSPTAVAYPADAGKISPLPVPDRFPGELVRKDNNINPGLRTATVTVTVPAGKVVASDVLCQGRGEIDLTSKPSSQAEQTINCDGSEVPSQLGVFASTPEKKATTYTFTIKANGPSRWLFAVSARDPQ